MLKNNELKIINDLEYPDHYQYSKKDFDEIIINAKKYNAHIITTEKDYDEIICGAKKYNAKIITTEKDYLRLETFNKKDINFIKSNLEILNEDGFIKTLIELNEKN